MESPRSEESEDEDEDDGINETLDRVVDFLATYLP